MKEPAIKGEDKHELHGVKDFGGLNTKADRTGIKDEEFSWIENVMPVGHGNARVIPQPLREDSFVYTSPPIHACQTNINGTIYNVVFLQNGQAYAVEQTGFTSTAITGSITFTGTTINTSQWQNQYLLILDPVLGYFTWDGTHLVHSGSVGLVIVTAGGTGYTSASVTFSAPNDTGGVQATGTVVLTGGVVTSIAVTEAGSGYTSPPTVTITGPGASATAVSALQTFATGTLSATVTVGGSGYTSAPAVGFSGGTGSGASAVSLISGGSVVAVIFTNPGSYTVAPSITFTGGAGSGAAATAKVNTTANVSVDSFSGHVWIFAGRTLFYSAPGSATDFTRLGSGFLVLTDETLFGNVTGAIAANSFLYFFGESSINVISDVRISNTGATVFTNTNVSANIGCKYPDTILTYFRSVVFFAPSGIYALVGSTTTKLSDALDGIFVNIDRTKPISSALAVIFDTLCLVVNFYVNPDPFNGTARNIQAVLFEKKWFISAQQNNTFTPYYIFGGESDGGAVAYCLMGAAASWQYGMFKMFSSTSNSTPWYLQTALWGFGHDPYTKQANDFGVDVISESSTSITVTADSEAASSTPVVRSSSRVVTWTNNAGSVVTWTNNLGQTVTWVNDTNAYNFYRGNAEMFGRYLGLTITGTTPDAVISTIMLEYITRGKWGK